MSNNQYPPSGQQLYQYDQYQQTSQVGFPPGNANYPPPSQAGFPPGSANYYPPPPGFPPGNTNAYPPPGQAGFPPGTADAYQQPPPPNYASATQGAAQGYPQDRKWVYEPQEQQGGQAAPYPGQPPQQWGGQGQFQQYQQQQAYQQYSQQDAPKAAGAAADYYKEQQQGTQQQGTQQPYQQPHQQPYPGQDQRSGYPQEYGHPDTVDSTDRGMGSTLVGGVAGAYVGKKLGMGKFMGAAGGAILANVLGGKKKHH